MSIWPSLAIGYLALDWIIRIVFILWIPAHRDPNVARSWILLAIFVPIPAAIAYTMIGRARLPNWRRTRFEEFDRVDEIAAGTIAGNPLNVLVHRVGGYPLRTCSDVAILSDYDLFVAQLIARIDASEKWVALTTYIFADDAVGTAVVAALGRAVARGVKCHVLFDALGSSHWRRGVAKSLDLAGVQARAIAPIGLVAGRLGRIDLRNHRKLYVIDGVEAFIGSQNIVARDFKGLIENDELMIHVEGEIVRDIARIFRRDWYCETGQHIEPLGSDSSGTANAQIVPSGPDYQSGSFSLVLAEMMLHAEKSIAITTPYFIPDAPLMAALRTALLKDVWVELFLSQRIDQMLVGLAQRSYYDELLEMGVVVHEYRDRLLHAKHVIVDGKIAYVGSSNVDIRSLWLNSEAGILFQSSEIAGRLALVLDDYRKNSRQLTPEIWQGRPRWRKAAENLARLLNALL